VRKRWRRPKRFHAYAGQKTFVAVIGTGAIVFLCLFGSALSQIRPVLVEMADGVVTDVVTESVNRVIAETMEENALSYQSFVCLEKDDRGEISALSTNMAQVNLLQSELNRRLLTALNESENTVIRIPMGNLLGGPVLSGRGPKIRVKIVSVTNAELSFSNAFTSAGINQTRHQMLLDVAVTVSMLLPGGSTSAKVNTQVCIAETVIVGDVPQSYTDIQTKAEE